MAFMQRFKRGVLLLGFMLVCVFLAACNGEEGGDAAAGDAKGGEKAANKDELVIAVNENFISMDPHNTGDTNSGSAQGAMLEGLLGFDEEGQIIPVLATEYSISDDAKEFTFKLRENVKFHDGEEFNADAVKVSFERIMNDEGLRLNSRGFNLVENIEVVNDHEIKVILKEPYGPMVTRFASAKILSPKLVQEDIDSIPKKPVGTGPFKFVEWVQGDHLTIEKFEDYWEPADRVAKITYKPVPENGSRVAMLKTGEAGLIYPLPAQNMKELSGSDVAEIKTVPSTIANYVSINTFKKPFDDQRVRQAFNYAVNKDAYIKVVKSELGLPLDSIIPSKTIHYEKQELYEHDVEKAKSLLKEAGYADGLDVEIWGNTNSDTMKGMQFIQQQLGEIGVNVEIKSMEEGTLSDEIYGAQTPEEAKLQMWYVSWSSYASDVTNATKPLFHSTSFPPNGANTAYYDNPQADELMDAANSSSDEAEQAKYYAELQETVYKDAPWIFLGVDEIVYGLNKELSGVYVSPTGSIDVRNAAYGQ